MFCSHSLNESQVGPSNQHSLVTLSFITVMVISPIFIFLFLYFFFIFFYFLFLFFIYLFIFVIYLFFIFILFLFLYYFLFIFILFFIFYLFTKCDINQFISTMSIDFLSSFYRTSESDFSNVFVLHQSSTTNKINFLFFNLQFFLRFSTTFIIFILFYF